MNTRYKYRIGSIPDSLFGLTGASVSSTQHHQHVENNTETAIGTGPPRAEQRSGGPKFSEKAPSCCCAAVSPSEKAALLSTHLVLLSVAAHTHASIQTPLRVWDRPAQAIHDPFQLTFVDPFRACLALRQPIRSSMSFGGQHI